MPAHPAPCLGKTAPPTCRVSSPRCRPLQRTETWKWLSAVEVQKSLAPSDGRYHIPRSTHSSHAEGDPSARVDLASTASQHLQAWLQGDTVTSQLFTVSSQRPTQRPFSNYSHHATPRSCEGTPVIVYSPIGFLPCRRLRVYGSCPTSVLCSPSRCADACCSLYT